MFPFLMEFMNNIVRAHMLIMHVFFLLPYSRQAENQSQTTTKTGPWRKVSDILTLP